MRTLYLHIGMPKAGSTSIQSAMRDAREDLEAEGLSYLRFGRNHSAVFRLLVGQTRKTLRKPLSQISLDELGLSAPDPAAVLDRVGVIAKASQKTAVISGEGLFGFTLAEVASVKAMLAPHFDRIRVVVYLRDPISWASSRAQQAVKTGRSTESELIEELDQRGRSALLVPGYGHLRSYVEVFGRDALICRPFDRAAFAGGDLIDDFLTTIGRPDLAGRVRSRISNPSLSQDAVRLLDALQPRLDRETWIDPKAAERIRRRLSEIPGQTYRLPPAVLRKVYGLAREDLDWVQREFGLDLVRDGPHFSEPRPVMDRRTADGIVDLVIGLVRKPLLNPRPPNGRATKRRRGGGLLWRLMTKMGLSRRAGGAKPVRKATVPPDEIRSGP